MILITGAGGHVGEKLSERISTTQSLVKGTHHCSTFSLNGNRIDIDLTSTDHINQLKTLEYKPEVVIHLAGLINIQLSRNVIPSLPPIPKAKEFRKLYDVNVIATANILEYCLEKGVKHLIFASSQTVYGFPQSLKVNENTPCFPLDHYGASKMCAEQLLRVGAKQGLHITCLRIPGIYGEKRKQGVVYNICKSAVQSKKIEVNIDYPLPIDVIHIDDVINAIERVIDFGGKDWTCLNISTGEACSLHLLAEKVAWLAKGCKVQYSPVYQPIILMQNTKARSLLNWKPKSSSEQLKRMLESVKDEE